jgi:hypothetical protein
MYEHHFDYNKKFLKKKTGSKPCITIMITHPPTHHHLHLHIHFVAPELAFVDTNQIAFIVCMFYTNIVDLKNILENHTLDQSCISTEIIIYQPLTSDTK